MAKTSANRFKLRYILDIYSLALEGVNEKTIAHTLGFTQSALSGWKKRYKSVQYALKKAEKDRKVKAELSWTDYIENRLPARLRPVWLDITQYSRTENGYDKIQKILKGKSKKIRQELLVYALLVTGFNLTSALRKVGIDRATFLYWTENDREFTDLLVEVEQIKKDFIETGLIRLIRAGDSPATIFANRTYNKDRGYGEQVDSGRIASIQVTNISIGDLKLPADTLRTILDAVQQQDKLPAIPIESCVTSTKALTSPSKRTK